MTAWLEGWKQRLGQLKREAYAIYLAYRDPRVPLHARIFAACVVGYAFSPIDLIPDFIPVLGALDDLLIVPLGVGIALRMIPAEVMADCRARAQEVMQQGRPVSRSAAIVIIGVWVALFGLAVLLVVRWVGR